jgi:hypothetical protein
MDELSTLDDLIDLEPLDTPDAETAPEPGELVQLRAALAERDRQHSATLDRLRQALLATDPAIDPEMVTGDTLEAVEASFAAARATIERIREALRQERAATTIPTGAPGRHTPSPKTALEKIRAGLAAK